MDESERALEPDADESLVDAMTHPIRGRILVVVAEGPPLSAHQIAELLEEPIQKVRYHLRLLVGAGLVELADYKVRRGVTENFYRSVRLPLVGREELSSLTDSQKLKIAVAIISGIFGDASRAVKARMMEDYHLSRITLELDAQGWRELLQINQAAFDEVMRVKEEAEKRLGGRNKGVTSVVNALLCFRVPQR